MSSTWISLSTKHHHCSKLISFNNMCSVSLRHNILLTFSVRWPWQYLVIERKLFGSYFTRPSVATRLFSYISESGYCLLFLTDMYIKDVQTKTTSTTGTPEIVKETVATALVNGNNILGKTWPLLIFLTVHVGHFWVDI